MDTELISHIKNMRVSAYALTEALAEGVPDDEALRVFADMVFVEMDRLERAAGTHEDDSLVSDMDARHIILYLGELFREKVGITQNINSQGPSSCECAQHHTVASASVDTAGVGGYL